MAISNVFKNYKNTLTGRNIKDAIGKIDNLKRDAELLDLTSPFAANSNFKIDRKTQSRINNLKANSLDKNKLEEAAGIASKELPKLKRNRALAIAGTATVPLAAV